MKIVAFILAFSFSLCHIGSGHVVESHEKEARETLVSQYSLARQHLKQTTDIISLPVEFAESLQVPNYNYLPVTKYLFIKIRILLI